MSLEFLRISFYILCNLRLTFIFFSLQNHYPVFKYFFDFIYYIFLQAFVSITHPNRGNLDIVLRSPMRTATRLDILIFQINELSFCHKVKFSNCYIYLCNVMIKPLIWVAKIKGLEIPSYKNTEEKNHINQDGVFKNIHNLFLDLKLQKQT